MIYVIYNLELGKFMFLYHIKSLPDIFETYFLKLILHFLLVHSYNTRSKSYQNYFLNQVRAKLGKKSIRFH